MKRKTFSEEDRQRIIFWAAANIAASKFGADVLSDEAAPFLNRVWLAYKTAGLPMPVIDWPPAGPKPVQVWLAEIFAPVFLSLVEPPRWISDMTWRYQQDRPLRFVGQIAHPAMTHATEQANEKSRVVYLFDGFHVDDDGTRRAVYKLVVQDAGSPGSSYY